MFLYIHACVCEHMYIYNGRIFHTPKYNYFSYVYSTKCNVVE